MPITQAHWRTVAQWEPWGKALTPNPSFFPNQREQSMQKGLLRKVADALVDRAPSSATPMLDHGYEGYEGAPEDGNAWFVRGQSKDEGSSREEKDRAGDLRSRMVRGGSWDDLPKDCRSASRVRCKPGAESSSIGLRVECIPQAPSRNA